MARERRRTIAVDFDGVIHRYSKGWHGGSIYDPPVKGAREALARIHDHYKVVIFTTRVNRDMPGSERQLDAVLAWLEMHEFRRGQHFDEITHVKPPALAYIDDRAIRFTDWESALDELGQLYRLS
jgi:hypothetical protein